MQHVKQPESSWALSLKHLKQKWGGSSKHKEKTQETQSNTKKCTKEYSLNPESDGSDKENRDPDQTEFSEGKKLRSKKSFFSLRSGSNKNKLGFKLDDNTFAKPDTLGKCSSFDNTNDDNAPEKEREVMDTSDVNTQTSTSDIIESSPISQMYTWFVGDLDPSVTETILFKTFSKYPGLMSLKIPKDVVSGNSLCYAYVNYNSKEQAEAAREGLNYTTICGSEIRIMPFIQDKNRRENTGGNVFLSHLPDNLNTRSLYEKFGKYGFILSCKYIPQKGQCFILYSEKMNAIKMIKQVNNTEIEGHIIYAGLHISKKERNKIRCESQLSFQSTYTRNETSETTSAAATVAMVKQQSDQKEIKAETKKNEIDTHPSTEFSIFIKNLPLNIEDHVIAGLVGQYGKVESVLSRKVPTRNGTWALVTLTDQESVNKSISGLNAFDIEGQKIFVTRAIPREQKSYARIDAKYPQKKFKILISGLAAPMSMSKFENVCRQFKGVSSIELYKRNSQLKSSTVDVDRTIQKKNSAAVIGTDASPKCDKFDYGYVEITKEADGNKLMDSLKKAFKCSCYKVGIEIPNRRSNYETPRFDYSTPSTVSIFTGLPAANREIQNTCSPITSPATLSYLNPTKVFKLSSFERMVEKDRQTVKRAEEKKAIQEAKKIHFQETERMADAIIWELSVRLFENEFMTRTKANVTEMVEIMVDHIVQCFWKDRFWSFWKFLEANQIDHEGRVLLKIHPLLKYQLVESAIAFGVVRPERRYELMEK